MSSKPTIPESYKVPAIWTGSADKDSKYASTNSATSGAQSVKTLPLGKHPLQLYSLGTPNGQKVTILLEELGLDYDAWSIDIGEGDQFTSGFVQVNPNSKIPAMMDHSMTPPIRVFESVSIMLYLAEQNASAFMPNNTRDKTEMMNWLIWQVGSAPYIGGGFGHFYKYAPIHFEYAIDRFSMEVKRQLDVLEKQLANKEYLVGNQVTLADFAVFPWIRCIDKGYAAREFLGLDEYKNVVNWMKRLEARPAVKRGLRVNGFDSDAVKERHSKNDF